MSVLLIFKMTGANALLKKNRSDILRISGTSKTGKILSDDFLHNFKIEEITNIC